MSMVFSLILNIVLDQCIQLLLLYILEATNDWYLNIDNGSLNGDLFLDLKKAFDTADHNILLGKLSWFLSFEPQAAYMHKWSLLKRTLNKLHTSVLSFSVIQHKAIIHY